MGYTWVHRFTVRYSYKDCKNRGGIWGVLMNIRFYVKLRNIQRRGRIKGRIPNQFGWVECKSVPAIADRAYDNELASLFNTHRAEHGQIYSGLIASVSVPVARSRNLIRNRNRHPKLDRRIIRWMGTRQITVSTLLPLRRSRGPERIFSSY